MKQRWETIHCDGTKGAVLAACSVWEKRGGGGNEGAETESQSCGGDGQGKQGRLQRIKNQSLNWDRPVPGQGLTGWAEEVPIRKASFLSGYVNDGMEYNAVTLI